MRWKIDSKRKEINVSSAVSNHHKIANDLKTTITNDLIYECYDYTLQLYRYLLVINPILDLLVCSKKNEEVKLMPLAIIPIPKRVIEQFDNYLKEEFYFSDVFKNTICSAPGMTLIILLLVINFIKSFPPALFRGGAFNKSTTCSNTCPLAVI